MKKYFPIAIKGSVFIILFSISFTATYFGLKFSKIFVKNDVVNSDQDQPLQAIEITDEDETLVIMGRGGEGHDGGTLTDSIILVSANLKAKTATLITIPRDLWVPLPYDWDNLKNFKVNAAYAIGADSVRYANKRPQFRGNTGPYEMTKNAVEQVTGIKPKHFIDVDFAGFKKIIDLLGSVEVTVPKTFDDYFYPVKGLENETCGFSGEEIANFHQKYSGFDLEKQFTCRYEHLHFDAGKNTMDGETALKFVRSRHSAEHGGDFARSDRQFALIETVVAKALSLDLVTKADPLTDQLVKTVKTDLDITTLKGLALAMGNRNDYKLTKIQLSESNFLVNSRSADGQYILVPKAGNNNFTEIKNYIAGEN